MGFATEEKPVNNTTLFSILEQRVFCWIAIRTRVALPKNYNFSQQKTFYLAKMNGDLEKKFFLNIASKTSEISNSKIHSKPVLLPKI